MKRLMVGLGTMALATGLALAAPAERWLHVRVQDGGGGKAGETVHVNIPLSLAEKVLPAVQADRLKDGKIKIEDCDMKGVDVRAVLQAIRDTRDGEFVTVEGSDNHVRVAKEKGYLVAKVRDGKNSGSKVDVRIPFEVVDALLTGADKDELNVVAAIRALGEHGDGVLVTVDDEKSNVRIWVDSRNDTE